jgi:hypothetical protein
MIRGIQKELRANTPDLSLRSTSDEWRAVSYVVRGELAFLFFIGASVALHPGFVLKWNEGGMSNYGLHIKTAVPYTLALSSLVFSSRRAAQLYAGAGGRSRRLSGLLWAYSVVVLSVMLSTYFYSRNIELKDLHFVCGTLLVVLVGVGSLWMYRLWPPSARIRALLGVQLLGDALALLTVVGTLHFLFLAEMLSNIGFAAFLIRTGRRIATEDDQVDSPYDIAS